MPAQWNIPDNFGNALSSEFSFLTSSIRVTSQLIFDILMAYSHNHYQSSDFKLNGTLRDVKIRFCTPSSTNQRAHAKPNAPNPPVSKKEPCGLWSVWRSDGEVRTITFPICLPSRMNHMAFLVDVNPL